MPLEMIVDSLENVAEAARQFYVAEDARFRLDVEGAVAKADADAVKAENETLKGLAYGADGKSYKDMFEGSQNALKVARNERNAIEGEIKGFRALGTLEEVQRIRDELEGFRAKGERLDDVQRQLADIKQANREYIAQKDALNAQMEELKAANAELSQYKSDSEKRMAAVDAENQIAAVVETMKEANQKALRRQLIDRYKAGDLVRGPNGKLFAQAENQTLEKYAREMMEDYNLFVRSTPGISNPPSEPARQGGSAAGSSTSYSSLAGMFH